MNAIITRALRYRFPGAHRDALSSVDWKVKSGEFVLVAGDSGAGKSTLLRCLNGLIPHFHGGRFGGEVIVSGIDTRTSAPRDLARHVGAVFQDPESQIITGTVEDEIAFGLENLGVSRGEIAGRVEATLDILGIRRLRDRETATLSGGERQIVAIAAALAPQPDILAFDEPTSQLDPLASSRVLDALHGLNAGGKTVIVAEHRVERILRHVGQVALVVGGRLRSGRAADLKSELTAHGLLPDSRQEVDAIATPGDVVARFHNVRFAFDDAPVLDGITVSLHEGQVVALMGPNGAGKTTLLKHLIGLLRPGSGTVEVAGRDITSLSVQDIARHSGYVPQNPTTILHRETLAGELAFTGRAQQVEVDIAMVLEGLGIAAYQDSHPLDLSGGERQRAAIAAIAAGRPRLLLLDEPTRGLPWHEKARLAGMVRNYARTGRAVLVATHDADFVRASADRVLVLAGGQLVEDRAPDEELGLPSKRGDQQPEPVLTELRAD